VESLADGQRPGGDNRSFTVVILLLSFYEYDKMSFLLRALDIVEPANLICYTAALLILALCKKIQLSLVHCRIIHHSRSNEHTTV
jgi:hypothetical protein